MTHDLSRTVNPGPTGLAGHFDVDDGSAVSTRGHELLQNTK